MKKFLSLVLALVMTMSLVTISAGAKDFTDDSAINYDEAIDVMSAVKVVEGYPDGSFQPSKTLTRAEAAKIICNLVLGPTTAAALSADTAPFKDVPASHWAAGYIAYCAQQGFINGYGNGVFGADDTLTGYQFMKMLLTALGYDAQIEGYVGGNWSIPVAKQALAIGLNDGNDEFDGNKAVTREEACLYSLNTLTANLVDYDSKTTVTVNGAEVVIGNSKAYELGQGSIYKDNMNKAGLQFAEKYFTELKLDASASDAFGRPANTWKVKGTKVGPYPLTADESYKKEVKGESIYEDLGKKVANSDITVFVDGKEVSSTIALVKGNGTKVGARGSLTEVFYDDDAALYYEAEKVVITTVNYFFGEVLGDYDTEDEEVTLAPVDSTVSNIASWKVSSEDVAGLEGLKDGDKVIFTAAWNTTTSKYDIKSVEVVEPVVAAVTEYTVPVSGKYGDGCVTAGGKEYDYNATYAANDRTYELKDDYKLYLDHFGNVIFADGVEAEGNYFFVTEYAKNGALNKNAKYEAAVYTLDGVNDVVTLNKVDDVKPTSDNLTFNKWVSFREKTTGKYDITTKTTVGGVFSVATPKAIENGKGGMQIPTVGTVRVTNSTIFVINDKNDNVTVYTGIKNVPTIDAATDTAIYAMQDGNYAKFVFVDVNSGHIKGAKNSDLIYFLKTSREDDYSQDVDDNTYYTYKAIVNGEEKKVKVEASVCSSINAQALYTDIVYSSSNYIDGLVKITTANTATGAAYEDDFMVVSVNDRLVRKGDVLTDDGNTMSIYLADGATATIIKASGKGIDTVTSARALSSIYKNTALTATIYAVLNADGEATALYIQL